MINDVHIKVITFSNKYSEFYSPYSSHREELKTYLMPIIAKKEPCFIEIIFRENMPREKKEIYALNCYSDNLNFAFVSKKDCYGRLNFKQRPRYDSNGKPKKVLWIDRDSEFMKVEPFEYNIIVRKKNSLLSSAIFFDGMNSFPTVFPQSVKDAINTNPPWKMVNIVIGLKTKWNTLFRKSA